MQDFHELLKNRQVIIRIVIPIATLVLGKRDKALLTFEIFIGITHDFKEAMNLRVRL